MHGVLHPTVVAEHSRATGTLEGNGFVCCNIMQFGMAQRALVEEQC